MLSKIKYCLVIVYIALSFIRLLAYSGVSSPGAVLLTPEMLAITVPVDWPAIVLPLSDDVATQVG